MKKLSFQRISAVWALSFFFPLNQAWAFESQGENPRLDTAKALAINRSMLARFESEYAALSKKASESSSDRLKQELVNTQYKIKALDEENKKLAQSLPKTLQADEFLKDMLAKSEAEKNIEPSKNPDAGINKKTGEDTSKLHERALEFVAKKEIKKAIQVYEEIILIAPNDDEAYLIMGHCFVLTGEFAKAEEAFQNAAHISPRNLSQILPFYENLVRQNPEDAEPCANLGFVCLMFGNIRRARESFDQALSLNPDNQTALAGLKTIESRPH